MYRDYYTQGMDQLTQAVHILFLALQLDIRI
jgi:hypothetical protein